MAIVPSVRAAASSAEPDEAHIPGGEPSASKEAGMSEGTVERRPFDLLYRDHFPFVWRSLRRLGVLASNLDDAAQEVFVVVHRRYEDFRAGTSERAWLFAIAQRVASDQRRLRRRKGGTLPFFDEVPTSDPTPYDHTVRAEASDLLLTFLAQLDEDQRAAFILSDLEQMTGREVAAALDSNVNTVSYRIGAARKHFVRFVEEQKLGKGERQP